MEAYVETYQEVEIKLTGKEASWLKAYVQNTLLPEETSYDIRYRTELFETLRIAGVE